MNQIDFTKTGGMPLTQNLLDFMQQANKDVAAALVAAIGNNVTVSGCVINGQNVSDGIIIYNNEIVPFLGGNFTTAAPLFNVNTITGNLTFFNGENKAVKFSKVAQIATAGNLNLQTFSRITTVKQISTPIFDIDFRLQDDYSFQGKCIFDFNKKIVKVEGIFECGNYAGNGDGSITAANGAVFSYENDFNDFGYDDFSDQYSFDVNEPYSYTTAHVSHGNDIFPLTLLCRVKFTNAGLSVKAFAGDNQITYSAGYSCLIPINVTAKII